MVENSCGARQAMLWVCDALYSLSEGAKRAFLAEEGGFYEGKAGWSSHRHLPRENFTSVHFCLSLLGEVADRKV